MKKVVLVLLISFSAFPMARWDESNKPELMENNYERNFLKLPRSGKLATPPWSDDYWPTYKGGITYRWSKRIRTEAEESKRWSYSLIEDINNITAPIKELSPAEKYDLYLGYEEFPLTKYERERTKIMKTVPGSSVYDKNYTIPKWEGLCHAWAPATLHYNNSEPITVVGKKGHTITFGSSDLHALLTYHLHLAKAPRTNFLGSRCNLDFKELEKKYNNREITKKELDDQMNSAECKDTNAGAFHVALVNQIGLMNQGFVVDITRDQEVWNQPVYSYDTRIIEVKKGASPGAAPGTVKEVTVYTKMGYVGEIAPTFERVKEISYIQYQKYTYRLELNASDEIIGGEWISFARPDFIWKTLPAKFSGYFKDLETLYKKSIQYLSPNKFTAELKDKMQRKGRISLIQREFIKDAKTAVALSKFKDEAKRIGVNHLAVEAFKEAAEKVKAERVSLNVAKIKDHMRTDFISKKFVEGMKEEVRNTHIANGVSSVNKKLKSKYLVSKFVKDVQGEVRDTHIENAVNSANDKLRNKYLVAKFVKEVKAEVRNTHIEEAKESAKENLRKRFLVKTFVHGLEVDANVTKVKEASNTLAKASIFINEVKKDAVKTREIKEENKKEAKAEIMAIGTSNFLRNKFIREVSKDAKASRKEKEENKDQAIATMNKFSNQNFYGKKFIKEVKLEVLETKKLREAQRIAQQLQLNKDFLKTVTAGDVIKAKELIKKGANPAYADEEGLTALMIAVQKEHKALISHLLGILDQTGINAVDKKGRNALIWAIVAQEQKPDRDTRSIVRELLTKNIQINQRDYKGMTALGYVKSGPYKSKLIEWALKDKGAKV